MSLKLIQLTENKFFKHSLVFSWYGFHYTFNSTGQFVHNIGTYCITNTTTFLLSNNWKSQILHNEFANTSSLGLAVIFGSILNMLLVFGNVRVIAIVWL